MKISYTGLRDKLFNFEAEGLQVFVIVSWSEEIDAWNVAVFFDDIQMLAAVSDGVLYSDDAMELVKVAAGDPGAVLPRPVKLKFAKINNQSV
jgi:hypothetical protein